MGWTFTKSRTPKEGAQVLGFYDGDANYNVGLLDWKDRLPKTTIVVYDGNLWYAYNYEMDKWEECITPDAWSAISMRGV